MDFPGYPGIDLAIFTEDSSWPDQHRGVKDVPGVGVINFKKRTSLYIATKFAYEINVSLSVSIRDLYRQILE